MPPKQPIANLSGAAVVDLKAELYRTREEFQKEKIKLTTTIAENGGEIPVKSTKVFKLYEPKLPASMASKKKQRDGKKDGAELSDEEEHNKLQASYVALQRKAAEYERRKRQAEMGEEFEVEPDDDDKAPHRGVKRRRGGDDDDFHTTNVMVDFTMKGAATGDSEVAEKVVQMMDGDDGIDPWVETVDQFGRTKIVRRSQVEEIRKMGAPSFVKSGGGSEDLGGTDANHIPSMMSADMIRDAEREQWEANARQEMEEMQGESIEVHYDRKQEPRTLGVGHYAFSKKGLEREKQMEELKRLREETVKQRSAAGSAKLARQERLEERKAMLRERKVKKLGSLASGSSGAAGSKDFDAGEADEADAFLKNLL